MSMSPEIVDDGVSQVVHIRVALAVYHCVVAGDGQSVRCLENLHHVGCKTRQEGLKEMAKFLAGMGS